jgi:hypothetical protein
VCAILFILAQGCHNDCPKRVGGFGSSTDFLMRRSVRSDIDFVRKL